jgi:hypothetical protein
VCRLDAAATVPAWASQGGFFSVTRTAEELSVVCSAEWVPVDVRQESGWARLKLEGPFPFDETGVLASFIQPLSDSGVPIFAVSTFDTDYVLVKEVSLQKALDILREAGHQEV